MSIYDEFSNYVTGITMTRQVVSIRDLTFAPTSLPPGGEGRFHRPGQRAYYFASGITGAQMEKYGNSDAGLQATDGMFNPPLGEHRVFDMIRYLDDHPSERPNYFSPGECGGWELCQQLRDFLALNHVSGATFPSHKSPGTLNLAVWPLSTGGITDSYFSPLEPET